MAGSDAGDLTCDRSWPPVEQPVTLDGLIGATQAQRNVAIHLQTLPSVPHLRQILLAQLQLSVDAGRLAGLTDHPTREHWEDRTATYRNLVAAARDVDGRLGASPMAVAASLKAAESVSRAGKEIVNDHPGLQDLAGVSPRVDAAVNNAIQCGLDRDLYLVPTREKRLNRGARGIVQAEHEWRPAYPDESMRLRDIARDRLRVPPPSRGHEAVTLGAAQRLAYETLLTQSGIRR